MTLRLEVEMPMTLHTEGFKDNPRRVAVMFGPVVMAAITELNNHFAGICADDNRFLGNLQPVAGKPLEFTGSAALFRNSPLAPGTKPVVFKPLFRLVDEPKVVYWDILGTKELERIAGVVKAEADRQRTLQSKTVDLVLCGLRSGQISPNDQYDFQALLGRLESGTFTPDWFKQVAEDVHGFETGPLKDRETSHADIYVDGLFCPMRFVPRSWIAYRMRVLPDQAQSLQVRTWRPKYFHFRDRPLDDAGKFEVLIDGHSIGICGIPAQPADQFTDENVLIPMELIKGKKQVKISFRSPTGGKNIRAGFYECRIMKASEPTEKWKAQP
jgi:hypothetical protein